MIHQVINSFLSLILSLTKKTVSPPRYSAIFYDKLVKLRKYKNFCLSALAVTSDDGNQLIVYVHSKLMIVDQKWFTIGSANFVDISFEKDHTEVNISVWDEPTARNLFNTLILEHIDENVSNMSGKEALSLFTELALQNRVKFFNKAKLKGHAFAINPETYALEL